MAVLTASSVGLSRLLEAENPRVALALNPLNTDARILTITETLNVSGAKPDLVTIGEDTEDALRYDVSDARLYSLLGEIEYQRGDKTVAYGLFEQARNFSKTEIHALQRIIVHSIEMGDLAKAVDEIDILLRRWPDRYPAVAASFPLILARPEGYNAVLTALAGEAPWRPSLFGTLSRDRAGIVLAERLLLDLKRSEVPPQPNEIASIISGYIAQKRYEAAYRLFLFTLSDEEEKLGGYVYNGHFAPVRTQRPFDWQVRDQSGLEITFAKGRDARAAQSGAVVRFLNTPVKDVSMQQYLQLPPGNYVLTLNISGRSLKLPKELFWTLGCVDSGAGLLKLGIPEGSYDNQSLTAGFSVGQKDCTMQILKLNTALIAESWRYRYVGVLTMHDIRIERIAA